MARPKARASHVSMRVGAAALVVGLLAGCGGGTVAVEASDPIVDDTPHAGITKFLRDWCCGRGSEWGPGPATVAAALERSSVVVLASVGGVRPGYVHRRVCVQPRGRACGDISHAGAYVELTSVQVLSGSLPSGATDLLVGRGVGVSAEDPDGTEGLRAQLPKGGQAVWFLGGPLGDPPSAPPPTDPANPPAAPAGGPRAGHTVEPDVRVREPAWIEYERTAHFVVDNRTRFVQGPDRVLAPTAMEDDPGYLGEESVLGLAARYSSERGTNERDKRAEGGVRRTPGVSPSARGVHGPEHPDRDLTPRQTSASATIRRSATRPA